MIERLWWVLDKLPTEFLWKWYWVKEVPNLYFSVFSLLPNGYKIVFKLDAFFYQSFNQDVFVCRRQISMSIRIHICELLLLETKSSIWMSFLCFGCISCTYNFFSWSLHVTLNYTIAGSIFSFENAVRLYIKLPVSTLELLTNCLLSPKERLGAYPNYLLELSFSLPISQQLP